MRVVVARVTTAGAGCDVATLARSALADDDGTLSAGVLGTLDPGEPRTGALDGGFHAIGEKGKTLDLARLVRGGLVEAKLLLGSQPLGHRVSRMGTM